MNTNELTPYLRNLWRYIITESRYIELTTIGQANLPMDRIFKTINSYKERMKTKLENVKKMNNEISKQFLLQLLDEPLPLIWPIILEMLDSSNEQIFIDVIREFSESDNQILNFMTFRGDIGNLYDHPQNAKENDLRNISAKMMQEKGIISKDYLLNTTDLDLIKSTVENFHPKEWIDPLYMRLERNMDFYRALKAHQITKRQEKVEARGLTSRQRIERRSELKIVSPQNLVQIHKPNKTDLEMMESITYWLGLNIDKNTDHKIIEDLYDFYQINLKKWITKVEMFEAFSNVFNARQFVLEELNDFLINDLLMIIPIKVDQSGKMTDSIGGDPYLDFVDKLKSQIADQAELKDLINLNGYLTKPFPDMDSNRVLAQDDKARAIMMDIIAEVSNTLVKKDKGLSDTIGAVMAQNPTQQYATANLKQTIEERRCCQMHGRTGDAFCNICGRVIPEEFRVEI